MSKPPPRRRGPRAKGPPKRPTIEGLPALDDAELIPPPPTTLPLPPSPTPGLVPETPRPPVAAVPAGTVPATSDELEPPQHPVAETESEEDRPKPVVPQAPQPKGETINISQLQTMAITELNQRAKDMAIENFGTMKKHEVIFQILKKNAERSGVLFAEGVLEILPEGFGFLRSQAFNYLPCPEDVYVSPSQIRRFDLQTGDLIA